MRRALLLRQQEESFALSNLLESYDVTSCSYPLFEPLFLPLHFLENPQALLITSKNALRAIQQNEALKEVPLYAVGDQTAQLAKSMGYIHVQSASGTAKDLINLVIQRASRDKGTLWHLSGDIIKENIAEVLRKEGFLAKRQIVYRINEVETMPPALLHDLQMKAFSYVLFFSSRTTDIFIKLLKKNGLEAAAVEMTSLCLSEDVLKKVRVIDWKKMWVSPEPTVTAMIGYFNGKE
jgi:uroporphyrinogen-III synthase